MLTPETIIRRSRELEGQDGADLGTDQTLTHEQFLTRLTELASQINASASGTLARAQLIDRYNNILYAIDTYLEFHQTPLPPNARIENAFTLIQYLDFEERLRTKGPWTLENWWSLGEIVAHIFVRRLSWFRRGEMTVDCLHTFKGSLPARCKISYLPGWFTSYEAGTEYMVVWRPHPSLPWLGKPMSIVSGPEQRVVQTDHGQKFWPFGSTLVGEFTSEASLSDLTQWLQARSAAGA